MGAALLMIFAAYFVSITFFTHSHLVDGQIITHSHPYTQAPDTGSHTHTSVQFQTIAHLSVLLMLAATFFFIASCTAAGTTGRVHFSLPPLRVEAICRPSLRGPPAVC